MNTIEGKLVRTGQCRVTLRNEAGLHLTYRVRQCQPWTGRDNVERPGVGYWIDVRSGDEWLSCGKLGETGLLSTTRNACADRTGTYGAGLVGLALAQGGGSVTNANRTYSVHVEERCSCCGRELTDPVSIERGIGPECYRKATGSKAAKVRVAS